MKILQISSARSIGGGERHLVDLSNELTKRGHEIFVAAVANSPLRERLKLLPAGNIREFPLRNSLDFASALKIASFIRETNAEIINAHFAKDYPVAALAARLTGVPFVVTRHVLFPMNGLHRFVLRQVKNVIAPSNAVAESLKRQGLFPEKKIVTIRYGLEVDQTRRTASKSHSFFSVGSIGNLDPVKGFDVLIRAAKLVLETIPNVKFNIVGEDRSRDNRNEKELRELIDELNLGGAVELAGWTDNVGDALSGFDVFVSASRSESFGFVIAESMLANVPVIATETAGAKEIISDPTLGSLVPIADARALADAIVKLISDEKLHVELSSHGHNHIAQHFSISKTVDETEALYRRVIDSG